MKKTVFITVWVLLTAPCYTQIKDTLYFINQTLLIGELKKIAMGKIEFEGDGIGTLKIKFDKIKTLKAGSHSYRIGTSDKKLYYGKIDSSGNTGNFFLISGNGKTELKLANITSLNFFGQNFSTRFSGLVGAGYSYTKSSDIGRLNFNGALRYLTHKFELAIDGDMIITSDSTSTFRERENIKLSAFYLIDNSWYAGTILSYQRNKELGLRSRWQQGAGIGYKFLQKQKNIGKAITGIVLNTEKNFSNVKNTLVEWALQGSYDFFSFSKPDISLSAIQILYVSLSQKGRIRNDGDIRLNWGIISDFSLNLSFYHNYDRKSPATYAPKTDYGFVAGLSYEF